MYKRFIFALVLIVGFWPLIGKSQSTFDRPLPEVKTYEGGNKDTLLYFIPLTFYNLRLQNSSLPCNLEVNFDGKLYNKYKLSPPYDFGFTISKNLTSDIKFEWDGEGFSGNFLGNLTGQQICNSKGDVYTSELFAYEWRALERKFNKIKPDSALCLSTGMAFKGLPYYTSRQLDRVKYPSIHNAVSLEVISACESIMNAVPKINYECTVGDSARKTRCDDEWVEITGGSYRKLDGYKGILELKLSGKNISLVGFENMQGRAEYSNMLAYQEKERLKKIEQDRKDQEYKIWFQSPEGKKYFALEEAKEKKAEEERVKAETLKKIESEKLKVAEKAQEIKIRNQCEKMTSWASDSRELIGVALKVSASSVNLLRFQMGQYSCLAVVDTPKGPEKCKVRNILQDKKTGEYFADLGGAFAIQAVCGGWAF